MKPGSRKNTKQRRLSHCLCLLSGQGAQRRPWIWLKADKKQIPTFASKTSKEIASKRTRQPLGLRGSRTCRGFELGRHGAGIRLGLDCWTSWAGLSSKSWRDTRQETGQPGQQEDIIPNLMMMMMAHKSHSVRNAPPSQERAFLLWNEVLPFFQTYFFQTG